MEKEHHLGQTSQRVILPGVCAQHSGVGVWHLASRAIDESDLEAQLQLVIAPNGCLPLPPNEGLASRNQVATAAPKLA